MAKVAFFYSRLYLSSNLSIIIYYHKIEYKTFSIKFMIFNLGVLRRKIISTQRNKQQ